MPYHKLNPLFTVEIKLFLNFNTRFKDFFLIKPSRLMNHSILSSDSCFDYIKENAFNNLNTPFIACIADGF